MTIPITAISEGGIAETSPTVIMLTVEETQQNNDKSLKDFKK